MRLPLLLISFTLMAFALKVPVQKVKIDPLMQRVRAANDTTYIVNFWATWCGPCVKELPVFDTIAQYYEGKKVKVILVSLDFPKDVSSRLPDFIARKGIRQEVVYLDEMYENEWIPKVDTLWQGNIPATLVIQGGKKYRQFAPREVHVSEIKGWVAEANR